ncbi:Six-hairpin glycosidase-like protein [Naematelia encephala]|uniref:Six-hairpin glycosidase-like protein n=1 Tax=Naematelia encephala TaxID=71784 RepID=A0A1Y2AG83_9TREE|nr:Six-hairpin glycosidase-like protein [Naematelia encephala]
MARFAPLDALPPVQSFSSHEFVGIVRPIKVHEIKGDVKTSGKVDEAGFEITLTRTGDEETFILLDYGHVVSGVPLFGVDAFSPSTGTSLLAAYSEGLTAAYLENGDGPFPFTSGANTLRAVPYDINFLGPVEDLFLQGGQRWQMIRLTKPGSVKISGVALRPAAFHAPIETLPGYFRSSDEVLNQIWECGTWTGQINQIPSRINTQSFIPTPLGTIVDSQRPSQYYHGGELRDYKISCFAQIHRGGLIFSIRNSTGFGLQVQFLLSEGGGKSTVRTFWGMYDEDQITLYQALIDTKTAPELEIGKWYKFEVSAEGDETVKVYIDGELIAELKQGSGVAVMPDGLDREIATPTGSFGFGCGKHQLAVFKHFSAVAIPSGKLIYSNALTSNSVLTDFAVGTNAVNSAYDGAKRDRAIWLGDTITQEQVLFYTTNQKEFMEASIDAVLSRQSADGVFPIYTFPGISFYDPQPGKEPPRIFEWLIGSFMPYIVRVVWEFFWHTGDTVALRRWYPKIVKVLRHMETYKDARGLLIFEGAKGHDSDYYNTPRTGGSIKQNALYVIALDRAGQMATALGEADIHTPKIQAIVDACNNILFNETTGTYDIAESMSGELSEDGNAFAINSGICPPGRARAVLEKMRTLFSPSGATSFPIGSKAMHKQAVVSPIMNAWHAQAAIDHGLYDDAREIYRTCYGPMIDKTSPWYSGAFWEFSTPEGTPFLDRFCSLAHPFSAQPVFHIGSYILGVRPTSPGFATYIVEPRLGLAKDLTFAQGRVPTPYGQVEVEWQRSEKHFTITVKTPRGIVGTLALRGLEDEVVKIEGKEGIELEPLKEYQFEVEL